MEQIDVKQTLEMQAMGNSTVKGDAVKLTKNMPIKEMVKVLMPEIKKALPSVMTPERFTRIAISALNNNPKLQQCTQLSFLGALMTSAQLG